MGKLDSFVKKLLKNKNKILTIDKIKNIYFDIEEDGNEKKLYKKIYNLKNKGYIVSLKKDMFFIKNPDLEIHLDDIIEKNYWKFFKKALQQNFSNNYFIGGIKSLEIWNNNFYIPDKLTVINPYKRSTEVLFKGKNIFYVNYKIKGFDEEKSFKFFKKQTEKTYIDGKSFIIANYELSLLESLYSMAFDEEKYILELVKKNIRKNWKKINLEVFEYFLKYGKYGSSVKKIYEIALGIRPDFAEKIKDILKKWYWI